MILFIVTFGLDVLFFQIMFKIFKNPLQFLSELLKVNFFNLFKHYYKLNHSYPIKQLPKPRVALRQAL